MYTVCNECHETTLGDADDCIHCGSEDVRLEPDEHELDNDEILHYINLINQNRGKEDEE